VPAFGQRPLNGRGALLGRRGDTALLFKLVRVGFKVVTMWMLHLITKKTELHQHLVP
jgi:hypothetical protein